MSEDFVENKCVIIICPFTSYPPPFLGCSLHLNRASTVEHFLLGLIIHRFFWLLHHYMYSQQQCKCNLTPGIDILLT